MLLKKMFDKLTTVGAGTIKFVYPGIKNILKFGIAFSGKKVYVETINSKQRLEIL